MTKSIVILQLAVLAVILESDLGCRKVGWFRVLRPFVTVVAIVLFFFSTLPTARNDLILQAAGALAGALLELASVSPLLVSVSYDPAWLPCVFRTACIRSRPAAVSRAGLGCAPSGSL